MSPIRASGEHRVFRRLEHGGHRHAGLSGGGCNLPLPPRPSPTSALRSRKAAALGARRLRPTPSPRTWGSLSRRTNWSIRWPGAPCCGPTLRPAISVRGDGDDRHADQRHHQRESSRSTPGRIWALRYCTFCHSGGGAPPKVPLWETRRTRRSLTRD